MKLYKGARIMQMVDKHQLDDCLEAGWSKTAPEPESVDDLDVDKVDDPDGDKVDVDKVDVDKVDDPDGDKVVKSDTDKKVTPAKVVKKATVKIKTPKK